MRALLRQKPFLTPAEKETWQPPQPEPDPEPAPAAATAPAHASPGPDAPVATRCGPLCPRCRKVMCRVGAWRTPQELLGLFARWRLQRRRDTHPP